MIRADVADGPEAASIETGPIIGIRTSRYLYGMRFDERTRRPVDDGFQLYDLDHDSFERENPAGRSASSKVERTLREALLEWDRNTPLLEAPEDAT